jgi:hypothetical protein
LRGRLPFIDTITPVSLAKPISPVPNGGMRDRVLHECMYYSSLTYFFFGIMSRRGSESDARV